MLRWLKSKLNRAIINKVINNSAINHITAKFRGLASYRSKAVRKSNILNIRNSVDAHNPTRKFNTVKRHAVYANNGIPEVREWTLAAEATNVGCFLEASLLYREGLSRNLTHVLAPRVRRELAYCLIKIGDLQSARSELNIVISEIGYERDSVLMLLQVLRYLGDRLASYDLAWNVLRHLNTDKIVLAAAAHSLIWAVRLEEGMSPLWQLLNLARSRSKLGSSEEAAIHTAIAHYELAFGNEDVGQKMIARILAGNNATHESVLLRARMLLDSGRYEQSRQLYEQAVEYCVEDPFAWAGVARSYLAELVARTHTESINASIKEAQQQANIQSASEEKSQIDEETTSEVYTAPQPLSEIANWAVQVARIACQKSCFQNEGILHIMETACRAQGNELEANLYAARAKEIILERRLNPASIKSLERQIERLQML